VIVYLLLTLALEMARGMQCISSQSEVSASGDIAGLCPPPPKKQTLSLSDPSIPIDIFPRLCF